MEISGNGHARTYMRSHAWRFNHLARGVLVRPCSNFPRRQRYARVRTRDTGSVPWPLTVAHSLTAPSPASENVNPLPKILETFGVNREYPSLRGKVK